MFEKLMDKAVRFLSIAGGFSSKEDIERAKRQSSPGGAIQTSKDKTETGAEAPSEAESVK